MSEYLRSAMCIEKKKETDRHKDRDAERYELRKYTEKNRERERER